jgi:CO/xanthine dehydrogenase Mo-binding subunit
MSTGPGLGYHIVDHGGAVTLPGSLQTNRRLSQWLRLRADGIVEVFSGKVEIGQGILTAVAQIVADELDVDLARVRMVPASTAISPNEGVTSGSLSVQHSGSALRYACAEVRAIYLEAAAQRLGVAAQTLQVRDGTIVGPGNLSTSYWELADEGLLERDVTARIAPKPAAARQVAGKAAARLDIPDKVFGRLRFIHDLAIPGMLYGRVLRPPSPGATLTVLEETAGRDMPGVVAVARDGSFAGVVAETGRGPRASRCRTRRICAPGSRASRSKPRRSARATRLPRRTRPARCGGSIRARSWRTLRWHLRAP